jgi:hypothetical protein
MRGPRLYSLLFWILWGVMSLMVRPDDRNSPEFVIASGLGSFVFPIPMYIEDLQAPRFSFLSSRVLQRCSLPARETWLPLQRYTGKPLTSSRANSPHILVRTRRRKLL